MELTNIITENENLIYKLASYFPYYADKEDLIQAGCKGMIDAYYKFDSSKGVKFTTYAYDYILGEMREVVRKDKTLKVSKEITTLKNKIERARELLSQSLMKEPTNLELSNYLEIPLKTLEDVLNSNTQVKRIDSNVGDTNMLLHEIIASPNVDVDTLIYLKSELENLEEPERSIMIQRYYEDMTQTEVAHQLGLSQVDVSRREKKVLTKIRGKLTCRQ